MEKGYYKTILTVPVLFSHQSQSTIKMEKGYYQMKTLLNESRFPAVAIHNKNGKGLLPVFRAVGAPNTAVAIHNKNGKGLLLNILSHKVRQVNVAIHNKNGKGLLQNSKRY